MKKMYFLVAFVLMATALQAQTVTQEQLQGTWQLTQFVNGEGKIDVVNGTWELNEKGEAAKAATEELYQGIIDQARGAVLTIKGDTAAQNVSGQNFKASYKLKDVDGKTYISMDDGNTGTPHIYIRDGKMYLDDEGMTMIYSPLK